MGPRLRVICPKEGDVRLHSNMGHPSVQNPLKGTACDDCALPPEWVGEQKPVRKSRPEAAPVEWSPASSGQDAKVCYNAVL